jgi:hypothetical protein
MTDDMDNGIAPHLLRPLRAPEQLDATFSARVMSAVHAEVRDRAHRSPDGWWRRRSLHLSPLGALAAAAGIAALVVLGTYAPDRPDGGLASRAALIRGASPDTVHVVRFVFTDPEARAVSLVGDFNAWSKSATPLVEESSGGRWIVTVGLPRGRHEYAFVVQRGNEERWATDPFSLPVRDDFGTETSIVSVGARVGLERAGAS